MKGLALEYVFKMFLYLVVVLVVLGLIINFRNQIIEALNLCQYVPGCKREEKCETILVKEVMVNENILNKYCNFCWGKTGLKDYKENCLCYVVKGSFSPFAFNNPDCELKCTSDSDILFFKYDSLFKKIFIEC